MNHGENFTIHGIVHLRTFSIAPQLCLKVIWLEAGPFRHTQKYIYSQLKEQNHILTASIDGKFIKVFNKSLTTSEYRLSFLNVLYMHFAYTPISASAPERIGTIDLINSKLENFSCKDHLDNRVFSFITRIIKEASQGKASQNLLLNVLR